MCSQDLHLSCFSDRFRLAVALSQIASLAPLAMSGFITDDEDKSNSDDDYNKEQFRGMVASEYSLLENLEVVSRAANCCVVEHMKSRSGKLKQRWAIDPIDGKHLRLVAGCIPILNDSRIILISSSSGDEWLIPKGGWENDEELEEAAIRECFEEAGVLGILGPKFDSFRAETRKSRMKRLQQEEIPDANLKRSSGFLREDGSPPIETRELSALLPSVNELKPGEEAASYEPAHTHVCMTFFPLYVQSISDFWPEKSRKRKAFDIDDAIKVIRPEFRSLLFKTKSLGLHLVKEERVREVERATISPSVA